MACFILYPVPIWFVLLLFLSYYNILGISSFVPIGLRDGFADEFKLCLRTAFIKVGNRIKYYVIFKREEIIAHCPEAPVNVRFQRLAVGYYSTHRAII